MKIDTVKARFLRVIVLCEVLNEGCFVAVRVHRVCQSLEQGQCTK